MYFPASLHAVIAPAVTAARHLGLLILTVPVLALALVRVRVRVRVLVRVLVLALCPRRRDLTLCSPGKAQGCSREWAQCCLNTRVQRSAACRVNCLS
jgi:hypothetical protein